MTDSVWGTVARVFDEVDAVEVMNRIASILKMHELQARGSQRTPGLDERVTRSVLAKLLPLVVDYQTVPNDWWTVQFKQEGRALTFVLGLPLVDELGARVGKIANGVRAHTSVLSHEGAEAFWADGRNELEATVRLERILRKHTEPTR